MNSQSKAMEVLIDGIMQTSKIQEKVPLSNKILRKRVRRYITYALETLLEYHFDILSIRHRGAFSFNCTRALGALGDLGTKRKHGYAWTTFQEHIAFLIVLDEGDLFKKTVSNCMINVRYMDLLEKYLVTLTPQDLFKNYDRYFDQAEDNVPVDIDNLKHVLATRCYSKNVPATDPVRKLDSLILELLIHVAENNNGCIPHYYECSSAGRLYGKGFLNLQRLPKRIRFAALPNCYVYDLQAGAISLLTICARRIDNSLKTDCIDDYVANRNHRRRQITTDIFGVNFEGDLSNIVKEAFTAIGFGARTQTMNQYGYKKTDLIFALDKIFNTHEWGNDKAKAFLEHEYVAEFIKELKEIKKVITDKYWNRNHALELVPGCAFDRDDENGKRKSKSKMLAHIYQSMERLALETMTACAGDTLLLPVHDGIVTSEKLDMQALNNAMRTVFGCDVAIDIDVVVNGNVASTEELHADFRRREEEQARDYTSDGYTINNDMLSVTGSNTIPGTSIEMTGDDGVDAMIAALNIKQEDNYHTKLKAA